MPIYLKIPGIEGEVTADGHQKWIECHSLSWGVGRGIHTPTGSAQSRESSAPSVSEVTIAKMADKSTAKLFQEACIGKAKDVEIHLCQTGDKLEFRMVTAAILGGASLFGGKGSILNSVLALVFLAIVLDGLVKFDIDPLLQQLVIGVILIIAVFVDTLLNKEKVKY